MKIGSKELIRNINRSTVLENIIENDLISRAALSKQLGLTKATISSIVQELIDKSLVKETGSADTMIGRKPTMLTLNQNAAVSLCIELGESFIELMATDLLGNPIYTDKLPYARGKNEDIIASIQKIIDSCLPLLPQTEYGLIGITISVHGIIDNNKVIFAPFYENLPMDVATQLQMQYALPVQILNEANLAVIGEWTFSINADNIASIFVHPGLGLGMLLNGKLYTGSNGYAGELGHMIIEADGRECSCGNKGCIDEYASEEAVLQELATRKNRSSISFEEYAALYRDKDADALALTQQFVKYISIAINNVLNLFNPQVVVLNCAFTVAFPELFDAIKARLSTRKNLLDSVQLSKMNEKAILFGATHINISNFLDIENFCPPKPSHMTMPLKE